MFSGKVAIVTGGTSGIGKALCEELGHRRAIVIVAGRNLAVADQVASTIVEAGGRARGAKVDITRQEEIHEVINDTISDQGRLDYMFNNAGIVMNGELPDMDFEQWRRIVDTNLWGVIYGTDAAYRVMVKQGYGHIVNIASAGGIAALPIATAYTATKYAVVGFSNSLRLEAAGLGIRVSVVCPGLVKTNILNKGVALKYDVKKMMEEGPLKAMDVTVAAKRILTGVQRNRRIIVFPLQVYLYYLLYRLYPGLFDFIGKKLVKKYRTTYKNS